MLFDLGVVTLGRNLGIRTYSFDIPDKSTFVFNLFALASCIASYLPEGRSKNRKIVHCGDARPGSGSLAADVMTRRIAPTGRGMHRLARCAHRLQSGPFVVHP